MQVTRADKGNSGIGGWALEDLRAIYRPSLIAHEQWLAGVSRSRSRAWRRSLRYDPEAAIVEAMFCQLVKGVVKEVEPFEDAQRGGPDFRCLLEQGEFYLECTAVSMPKATRATGISVGSSGGPYALLNQAVLDKLTNKAKRLGNLDGPCVLGIGLLHPEVGAVALSRLKIEFLCHGTLDRIQEGTRPRLGGGAFITYEPTGEIRATRKNVSALLLGGLAWEAPKVYGLLNPGPLHRFDPSWLGTYDFCRLKRWPLPAGAVVECEWTGGVSR